MKRLIDTATSIKSRIMEKLIDQQVGKTKFFLLDLVELESRYTTISSDSVVKFQTKLKENLEAARNAL